jgi:hypothetical protein
MLGYTYKDKQDKESKGKKMNVASEYIKTISGRKIFGL